MAQQTGFDAWLARLRDALTRARAVFDARIADPVIARVAPKADARVRDVLRLSMLTLVLLLTVGAMGGGAWYLFKPDQRIVIVVAGISGDDSDAWHARVHGAIAGALGSAVIVRDVRDTLPRENDIADKAGTLARDRKAQAVIQRENGAVLVWGEVSPSGHSAQLFFLAWDGTSRTSKAHRYLRKAALRIDAARDDAIDSAIALFTFHQSRGHPGQIAKVGPQLGAIYDVLDKRAQAKDLPDAQRGEILRAEAIALMMHPGTLKGRPLLKRAAELDREALDEISPVAAPYDWLSLRADYANLLSDIGSEEGPSYTRDALAALTQVIAFYPKERAPYDWATMETEYGGVQADLGSALQDSGAQQAAVDAYRATLDAFTEKETPLDWADTQERIGGALRQLSFITNSQTPLQPALDALHLALKERTRESAPYDWAETEGDVADVERLIADNGSDPKAYDAAVAACREVLKVYTRSAGTGAWASAEIGLANALSDQAKAAGNSKAFDESVADYKSVLEVYDAQSSPSDRALTLYDLGIAFNDYGQLKKDAALFKQAIATLNDSIALYHEYGFSGGENDARNVLNAANANLAKLKPQ